MSAFADCSSLTSVTIPNTVTSIQDWAFDGCSDLASISLGNSLYSINEGAFYGCSKLTSITIPASVSSISDGVFNGCTALKDLRLEDGTETLKLGCNYHDPSGIGKCIFYDCPLKTIYLGRNLSYQSDFHYGYSPFCEKQQLTSVIIGNSVTSIGKFVFCKCYSLTSITIPTYVTTIGDQAFQFCSSLPSITIPNSATSIGLYAFNNCSFLTNIRVDALTPPEIKENTFDESHFDNVKLHVPSESLEAYKQHPVWGLFSIADIETGINEIELDSEYIDSDWQPCDIYNLQGVRVLHNASKDDFDALAPGCYILNRANRTTKIFKQ